MTHRQLLWRIELPLAMPEIIAGLRIATVSTVAIATLAFFAGAGGLGAEIYTDITFKTGIVVAAGSRSRWRSASTCSTWAPQRAARRHGGGCDRCEAEADRP